MTTTDLREKIDAAVALLESVDREDSSAMFDCLVELEMLANDAIADYSVARLLRTRRAGVPNAFSTAA